MRRRIMSDHFQMVAFGIRGFGISMRAKCLRVMPRGGCYSSAIHKQDKELHIDWAKVYVARAKIAQNAELADNWLT